MLSSKSIVRKERAWLVRLGLYGVIMALFISYSAVRGELSQPEISDPTTHGNNPLVCVINRIEGLFVQSRCRYSSLNACVNNLRQIDGAKQQWALENRASETATPRWKQILSYLGRDPTKTTAKDMPVCPHGGVYITGKVSETPRCTIPGHVLP